LVQIILFRYKYRDNGYDRNLTRAIKAYYYACISFVDYQIGRVLDELEKTGQADNTMIIFTADHGEHLGDYRCYGKRSMHDSCARIPLIISMPGRFEGGRVCEDPASLVDIAPTILGAADVGMKTHKLDGIDLNRLINGKSDRKYVYSQLSFYNMGPGFIQRDTQFEEFISFEENKRAAFSTYMAAGREWKYFYSAPDNREYLIWNSAVCKHIKKDFQNNRFPYEELKRYWAITETSSYKPIIPKDRILLISGLYDRFVPIKDSYNLFDNWGQPRRLLYR
jgi:hypothetical protein